MKRILKYELELDDRKQSIATHKDAEILSVQVQGAILALWILCDEDMPVVQINLITIGTGQIINMPFKYVTYIGTYQYKSFVGHVFRIP